MALGSGTGTRHPSQAVAEPPSVGGRRETCVLLCSVRRGGSSLGLTVMGKRAGSALESIRGQRARHVSRHQRTSDLLDFPPLGTPSQGPSRQQSISLATATRKSTPDVPLGFEHQASSLSQSGRATPTVPPGLSAPPLGLSAAHPGLEGLGQSSGRATPAHPPGLSAAAPGLSAAAPGVSAPLPGLPAAPSGLSKPPTAIPTDVAEDVAATGGTISRPGSRAALKRQITPVLPLRPATPKREVSLAGKESARAKEVEIETPTKKPAEAKRASLGEGNGKGKESVREVKAEAAKVVATVAPTKAKDEETAKPPAPSKPESKPVQPPLQGAAPAQPNEPKAAFPVTPSKLEPSKARKHPGKLDITAAVEKTPERASTQAKSGAVESATPTTAAQTPSKLESPGVASPAVKNAPRTLRVVQTPTPKGETPPVVAATAPSAEKPKDAVPAAVRAPSRQPSVASIQNLPGTPSSEQVSISDNVSMTSTSQSRANSPPPSARTSDAAGVASKIVGSAPVRQKTKAQTKKDRQERAKQLEEEKAKADADAGAGAGAGAGAAAKTEEEAIQQEAIVSRKKKAKKEKPALAPYPPAKGKEKDDSSKTAEKTPVVSPAPSPSPKAEKGTASAKTSKPSTPIKTPTAPQPEPSPPPTPTLTAAQIIAELKAKAPEIQKSIESLLRASPTSTNTVKPSQPVTAKDLANPSNSWHSDLRSQLSKDDVDALLRGSLPAKHFGGKEGRHADRAVVSPTGATLRALTKELEDRFLELERALRDVPEELRFRATKPQNETRFPGIDLEALRRELEGSLGSGVGLAGGGGGGGGTGGVSGKGGSAMEQMVHDGSGTKRGAFLLDEVGKYINEFVMPPATPPPQTAQPHIPVASGQAQAQPRQDGAGAGAEAYGGGGGVSVEIAERQLAEARRVCEEREAALRKVVRKNKKILGLG